MTAIMAAVVIGFLILFAVSGQAIFILCAFLAASIYAVNRNERKKK